MRAIFIGVAIVIAALVTGIAAVAEFDAQKQSLPSRRERPTAAVAIDSSTDAEWASDLTEIEVWAKDTERHEREWSEGEWNAGIERQRLADEAAAARAAQVRSRVPSPTAVPSGDCATIAAQFGVSAQTVWNESRCTYGAFNAGGCSGRGCIGAVQLDLGHFAAVSPWNPSVSGVCYGLDPNSIADQQTCASRLPASAW